MEQLKLSKNTEKLHQMFGKKLYSDKYSFISEICQNAVDSHRMAGQTLPVKVGIDANNKFFVLDRGLSFSSKEDFVEKVCTILESGKTDKKTNDEDCPMGMHGIGSISVSAYSDMWEYRVITPDHKGFIATLREVEGIGLTYDLSEYFDTTEEKEVLFKVPVSNAASLIGSMKEKLCYFKDIEFVFPPNITRIYPDLAILNSTFEIFESDDFQVSTLFKHSNMHICLDQYTYQIRWEKLGMMPIQLPIGLKFKMADGLVPDITRENIMFNPEYKTILLKKIESVRKWIIERYNSNTKEEYTSLQAFHQADSSVPILKIGNTPISILYFTGVDRSLLNKVQFKDIPREHVLDYIKYTEMGKKCFKFNFKYSTKGAKSSVNYSWEHLSSGESRCLVDIEPSKAMIRTLKENCKGYSFYKRINFKLSELKTLLHLCSKTELRKVYFSSGTNLWREKINSYKKLLEVSTSEFFPVRISTIKIPEHLKVLPRVVKKISKEEIVIKYAGPLSKYSRTWDCNFTDKKLIISEIHKLPYLHIHGTLEDRVKLNYLYLFLKGIRLKSRVKVCIISDTNRNKLKGLNIHNVMSIDEFLKGETRLFKKVMTAHKIYTEFYSKHKDLFLCLEMIKLYISEQYAEDLKTIKSYIEEFNTYELLYAKPQAKEFLKELENLAKEKSLYDFTMLEKLNEVSKISSKIEFITLFSGLRRSTADKKLSTINAIHDICKQRKLKMDIKHYDKKQDV